MKAKYFQTFFGLKKIEELDRNLTIKVGKIPKYGNVIEVEEAIGNYCDYWVENAEGYLFLYYENEIAEFLPEINKKEKLSKYEQQNEKNWESLSEAEIMNNYYKKIILLFFVLSYII